MFGRRKTKDTVKKYSDRIDYLIKEYERQKEEVQWKDFYDGIVFGLKMAKDNYNRLEEELF